MTPATLPPHVRDGLEALLQVARPAARVAQDPVSLPRRYADSRDQEVAGLLAAGLAFGRVAAFLPVLEALARAAEDRGGFHAWALAFSLSRDGAALAPLNHRWTRGTDLALLVAGVGGLLRDAGSLEAAFMAGDAAGAPDLGPGLAAFVDRLRGQVCAAAGADLRDLPRGLRHLLPSPADGSACKRWNLFLRWMVRSPREGVDLGIWTGISPARLVIPLDTHVLRLSRWLGLTARTDGSWRTAVEVTRSLARLDPADPLRFDFALAHLGISGTCTRRAGACAACPLGAACRRDALERGP